MEYFDVAINIWKLFWANSGFFIIVLLALLYLLKKKEKEFYVFGIITLLIITLFFNPFFEMILMEKVISSAIYWRILWAIPVVILLGYFFTEIQTSSEWKKWEAFVVTSVFVAILCFGGKYIYTEENFYLTENFYKIPQAELEVCTFLSEEKVQMVCATQDLACFVRMYDAKIHMPYGRHIGQNAENEIASALKTEMLKEIPDYELLFNYLEKLSCNYVVRFSNEDVSIFENYGYNLQYANEKYFIFAKNN